MITYFYLLVVPILVLCWLAYQYKNPFLLIFAALLVIVLASLAYTGKVSFDQEKQRCDVVSTTHEDNSSTVETTCELVTINNTFYGRMMGLLLLFLSMYLLFQAVLGVFFVKEPRA